MKYLKWIGIALILVTLLSVGCFKMMSKPLPPVIQNENADELATLVLDALNKEAWDSLKYLQWDFMLGHKFKWDKANNIANIKWGDHEVILNLDNQTGNVFSNGTLVTDEKKKQKKLQQAWSHWCNDSFWMFAPYKLFDPGVSRTVVELEGNVRGLSVAYESGGVTPGDQYIWHIDENNMPIAYQMYVKILPVKGMKVTWDGWINVDGAKLATKHGSSMMNFEMKNVKGGQKLESINAFAKTFEL